MYIYINKQMSDGTFFMTLLSRSENNWCKFFTTSVIAQLIAVNCNYFWNFANNGFCVLADLNHLEHSNDYRRFICLCIPRIHFARNKLWLQETNCGILIARAFAILQYKLNTRPAVVVKYQRGFYGPCTTTGD